MKVNVELLNEDIEISKDDLSEILSIISWDNRVPVFYYPGRVAWYELRNPATNKKKLKKYTGVKIKGVGVWNPQFLNKYDNVKNEKYFENPAKPQPYLYEYTKDVPHFGINKDGEFAIKYGSATPFGGLFLDRAINEFNNANHLLKKSVSSAIPLLVCEYPELYFENHKLGSVVSLVPNTYPCRLDTFLYEKINETPYEIEYNKAIFQCFNADDFSNHSRLKILSVILKLYGSELLKFSNAGLYRHSGGINNIYFDIDDIKVVFTDLDSSMSLDNIPKPIQALEILRDLASVLYKVIYRHCNPMSLNKYDLDSIKRFDPFKSVLNGYFKKEFDSEINNVSDKIWKYCESIYLYIYKQWHSNTFEAHEWSKYCKIEKDIFFLISIYLTMDLYKKMPINKKYPLQISKYEFLHRTSMFLGDRYKVFENIIS